MYIDETGGNDDAGELKVTVSGDEYTADETYDYDHDGTNDTAITDTDDGGHLAFTDTDHDGNADLMTTYDADGHVESQAHFDASTGEWVAQGGDQSGTEQTSTDTNSGSGETITVDTADGGKSAGAATIDSDHDGTADTAVVQDQDGSTILFTDTDGDGHADQAVTVGADGEVTTQDRSGDHDWKTVEHGHLDPDGTYHKDGDGGTATNACDGFWGESDRHAEGTSGVLRIDSTTGQWISAN